MDCVPYDGNTKRTAARDNLRVTVYNGVSVVVFMEIRGSRGTSRATSPTFL
jgi:hypothetical protein